MPLNAYNKISLHWVFHMLLTSDLTPSCTRCPRWRIVCTSSSWVSSRATASPSASTPWVRRSRASQGEPHWESSEGLDGLCRTFKVSKTVVVTFAARWTEISSKIDNTTQIFSLIKRFYPVFRDYIKNPMSFMKIIFKTKHLEFTLWNQKHERFWSTYW